MPQLSAVISKWGMTPKLGDRPANRDAKQPSRSAARPERPRRASDIDPNANGPAPSRGEKERMAPAPLVLYLSAIHPRFFRAI